jgi:hypothetical protein
MFSHLSEKKKSQWLREFFFNPLPYQTLKNQSNLFKTNLTYFDRATRLAFIN